MWRAELQVSGPEPDELRDFFAQDLCYILQETVGGLVGPLETSGGQKLAERLGLGSVTLGVREVRALK